MRPCRCVHITLRRHNTQHNIRHLINGMCHPCSPFLPAHLFTDEPVDLAACCGMAPAMWGMQVTLGADLLLWLLCLRRLCSQVMQLLLLLLLIVRLPASELLLVLTRWGAARTMLAPAAAGCGATIGGVLITACTVYCCMLQACDAGRLAPCQPRILSPVLCNSC